MSSDNYIDPACFEIAQHLILLRFVVKARKHFDSDGKFSKTLSESTQMLERKDSCRSKNRRLSAVCHSYHAAPHRNFSLSESDISAEKPVCYLFTGKIMLEFADGACLIRCFAEREIPQKFAVKRSFYLHRLDTFNTSLRVKFKYLRRDFLDFALYSRHRLLPERCAERTYLRENTFLPAVTVDVVHIVDRNIDSVVVFVAQGKTVGSVHNCRSFINADTEFVVNNELSGFKRIKFKYSVFKIFFRLYFFSLIF